MRGLLAAFVAVFALVSLWTYFLDYTPQRTYGGRHAELATQIAPTLNTLKDTHRIHFVGAPVMYWGFATLPFLVPNADAGDILDPLQDPLPPGLLPADRAALFIFMPQRLAELDVVRQALPGGDTWEVRSPLDGRHMATLYRVWPGA